MISTNTVGQHLAAIMADDLKDLLDFLDKARVVDRFSELDVAKVTRTLRHILCAGLALELPIDGAKERVVQAAIARLGSALVHCLWIYDVGNAHALDLLGRQKSKLDLLDRFERRTRVRKVQVRHLVARGRVALSKKRKWFVEKVRES